MKDELNHVDLAFVVDTTGSMGAFIHAARAQMIGILQGLGVGRGCVSESLSRLGRRGLLQG